MKNIIALFLLLCICSGCNSFVIKNNFYGNFYLVASDIGEDLALSYYTSADESNYTTIVGPTVFAIGYNENYMIIKQHPRSSPNSLNKNIINFFILPIKTGFDWKNKNGLIGPLDQTQFQKEIARLKLKQIRFSIIYADLE